MGRYYSGDIDGKFWFAIQSSNCADRFGCIGNNPNYLEYYFTDSHIEEIEAGLNTILKNVGEENFKIIDEFFKEKNGWNEDMLLKHFHSLGKPQTINTLKFWLEEYADYGMGQKILKCVKEQGECSFTAEC